MLGLPVSIARGVETLSNFIVAQNPELAQALGLLNAAPGPQGALGLDVNGNLVPAGAATGIAPMGSTNFGLDGSPVGIGAGGSGGQVGNPSGIAGGATSIGGIGTPGGSGGVDSSTGVGSPGPGVGDSPGSTGESP
jgi:hypothetical protein